MQQKNNSDVQKQGVGPSYKAYTFDSLLSLSQKIHEITEFEHQNYFSTTASHYRIKKGSQVDKTPQSIQPSQQGLSIIPDSLNNNQSNTKRIIRTAGETQRPRPSSLHQGCRKEHLKLTGNELTVVKIISPTSQTERKYANKRYNVSVKKRTFSTNAGPIDNTEPISIICEQAPDKSQLSQRQQNLIEQSQHQFEQQHQYVPSASQQDLLLNKSQSPLNFGETQKSVTWRNSVQLSMKSLMHNPTDFYHLKTVGFKNYKYPRPPSQPEYMFSPEAKNKIPLYQVKDNTGVQLNNIENVCVKKIQNEREILQCINKSIKDIGNLSQRGQENEKNTQRNEVEYNNFFGSIDSNRNLLSSKRVESRKEIREKRQSKNSHKMLFEMNQYNRQLNLFNLQKTINQNNSISRSSNIFQKWKPLVSQSSSQNLNLLRPNSQLSRSQKNLNVISIDRVSSPLHPPPSPPQQEQQERVVKKIQQILCKLFLIQKLKSQLSQRRCSQQYSSNSKKLTIIIEAYNRLAHASEQYRQNDMMLEGESPQKQNKIKVIELSQSQQQKLFNNKQQIYLGVFIKEFNILHSNKKAIISRILFALGLDETKEFSSVLLEQIIQFYKILIHKDSMLSESVPFLEKFFKGSDSLNQVDKQEFKSVLKLITSQVQEKNQNITSTLYQKLLLKFEEGGVISQSDTNVYFNKFKDVFVSGSISANDIIDLICGNVQ